MSRRVILWDVMDTLVRDPFRDAMPAFFGMTLDEMLAAKHPTAWGAFERGELSESAFLTTFFRDGRAYDTEGFKACIRAAYHWMDGMQDLLRDLKARDHAMHTLSNYPEWHRWIEERLGLSRYLRWTFVSCRTGLRKPERESFLSAARALALRPSDCLFIDDRAKNCDAACDVGMLAIQFSGDASSLRDELARRGWL
jgi:HAD superfamily hydrolase (TIGR01509 family)